jgi:hypothetical protein
MKFIAIPLLSLLLFNACLKVESIEKPDQAGPVDCRTPITIQGKYYEKDGKWWLYGGPDSATHFDASNFTLDVCKLRYGLGREHFNALREPGFDHISERHHEFNDLDRIVVLRVGSTVKLYPLSTLRVHELVNDRIGGESVMVVYCFLAELAAVYERTYCGKVYTFGVSGYTYLDQRIQNGLESFVLWDRETESLWWPITDRGISGEWAGGRLHRYNGAQWEERRWSEIRDLYPNALVLKRNQYEDPPESWVPWEGC